MRGIENLGYTKQNVILVLYMAVCVSPLSMAANLPCLPGSPYSESLTSFVPPAHNQGVSLAPQQGHALWKVFLPTTGSFFVLGLADSRFCPSAPFGGRFLMVFVFYLLPFGTRSFACGRNPTAFFLKLPGSGRKRFCWPFITGLCYRRSSDISYHL